MDAGNIDALIIAPTGPEFLIVANIMTGAKLVGGLPFPAKRGKIGPHTVLCCASGKGQEEAAAAITLIAERFHPRFLFLVGIAGGFPDRGVHRGDVIVASVIHSFDYGKLSHGEFIRRPENDVKCDKGLIASAEIVAAGDQQWRNSITERHPDNKDPSDFKIHPTCYVASSNKVVDDPNHTFYATVARSFPEIHAVEMEGIGAGASASLIQRERPLRFLMIRGISDEPGIELGAGTEARHKWKKYAAATAAAFTRSVIEQLPPKSEDDDPEFDEAKTFFKDGRFAAALSSFRSVVHRNAETSEARYYLVLSALSGVRPRLLHSDRVAEIDVQLREALLGAKDDDAHIRYLWAILRHDCYRLNGLREPAPTSKELLAGEIRLEDFRAREITSAIAAPGNSVWEVVLNQQSARS